MSAPVPTCGATRTRPERTVTVSPWLASDAASGPASCGAGASVTMPARRSGSRGVTTGTSYRSAKKMTSRVRSASAASICSTPTSRTSRSAVASRAAARWSGRLTVKACADAAGGGHDVHRKVLVGAGEPGEHRRDALERAIAEPREAGAPACAQPLVAVCAHDVGGRVVGVDDAEALDRVDDEQAIADDLAHRRQVGAVAGAEVDEAHRDGARVVGERLAHEVGRHESVGRARATAGRSSRARPRRGSR